MFFLPYASCLLLSNYYSISVVMASDQVFIATTQINPTPVSGPRIEHIPKIFMEETGANVYNLNLNKYVLPASLVIDLGETIPVNTLEISTF